MPPLFPSCPIQKIISGGQTGVDRAALAVAVYLEVPHGGWCPRGRRAEDGAIPSIYQLEETASPNYAVRTQQNIESSDGTLVLVGSEISGGTALTISLAKRYRRPLLVVSLDQEHDYEMVRQWLVQHQVQVLNVAGPRESSVPNITRDAEQFLVNCLTAELPEPN
jgi:hypothetical protein